MAAVHVPEEDFAHRWVRVNGLWMHTRVKEDAAPPGAPALVLVHGLVVASRYMLPGAVRLARHFRVYVPELPGFGESDKPREVLDVAGLAEALAGWMEAAGLARALLLANSFGCQTLVELARRFPERVERMVLQGPTGDPATRSVFQQLVRWQVNSAREPAGMGRYILSDYRKAGLRRAWRTFRAQLADPVKEKLPQVQTPTLVLRGSRDAVVTQAWAEEVARRLSHGRLVVVPGAVHTFNFYYPRELERVVLAFLAPEGGERVGDEQPARG